MQHLVNKPKLVFFMPPMDNYPPTQLGFILHQMVSGISEFFDLVIVSEDCDYAEVCDLHQPDITMFDSGHEMLPCRVRVSNTSAFPEIPKIGYIRSDAFSHNRTVFLSDMDQWGVETFFTCDTAMAEYTPQIAGQLFYWPHFINTTVFRDYHQEKSIHVLFVGNCDGPALEYHWRIKIKDRVTKSIPSLVVPHPGYNKESPAFRIYGEQYARLINASLVVPTCGAMSKVVVMKHLEIPAAKACLVTERTPAVEAFGFVDMVNCVFADENDVVDKLKHLFSERELLDQITEAGYQLVHSRHTVKQRPQVAQWLQLRRSLKPGQRIVQLGMFDDLKVVEESSSIANSHIINNTVDRNFLRAGDEKLAQRKIGEAKLLYSKCFDYIEWMPEPKLRLGLCALLSGDVDEALDRIGRLVETTLGKYEAQTPDPVEWAWLLVILICRGNLEEAAHYADYFPQLKNLELVQARWVIYVLARREAEAASLLREMDSAAISNHSRKSIHQLPRLSFDEYVKTICDMLRASGQRRFARRVATAASHSRVGSMNGKVNIRDSKHEKALGKERDDVPALLNFLRRVQSTRRPKLSERLKRRVPGVAVKMNKTLSRYPIVKAKIRSLALNHLKIQDW